MLSYKRKIAEKNEKKKEKDRNKSKRNQAKNNKSPGLINYKISWLSLQAWYLYCEASGLVSPKTLFVSTE